MASYPSPRTLNAQASPSPRSQAPQAPNTSLASENSIPEQPLTNISPFNPSKRPGLGLLSTNGSEAGRRPSVQFVPQISDPTSSRSSSARPAVTRTTTNDKRRLSSPPPPAKFQQRVSFDTFDNRDASDFSLTLNRKHRDYEYTKRSRTFLCGTDTNEYSDTALEWLIDELVDDGDEVVCLRVVEKDSREAAKWAGGQTGSGRHKSYREEAERMLMAIEKKNTENKAINLVLEFSVGKVHETIQHMIRIYEPAILVVGTRGRSLTGYQGLLSSGSVSKYCLQYSPVPVIVVRPSSKREKKKRKRMRDPSRTGYRDILDKSEDVPSGRGGHLLDERHRSNILGERLGVLGELGSRDPDEEARMVAEAIGYRAGRFPEKSSDGAPLAKVSSAKSDVSGRSGRSGSMGSEMDNDMTSPAERLLKSPELRNLDSPTMSDAEDSDEEDEDIGSMQESVLRPEDEAAMLAYERAQSVVEEVEDDREQREERAASRDRRRSGRSSSRGKDDDDEGGGAGVLGLLAQLDRGMDGTGRKKR